MDQQIDIHTDVRTDEGTPVIAVVHPAADPKHPDHESFLKRLGMALGQVAFDTAVLAGTSGVVRIGIYAGGKKS